jgi:hypothetical protein
MARAIPIELMLCGLLAGAAAWAQTAPASPLPANARPAKPVATPPFPPPPLPPPPRNPVDTLRRLLAMNWTDREQALADKSDKQRQYLRQRLSEFDALSPADRELRLRLLQLRYYLVPLMRTEPANRAEQLRLVSAEDRKVIEDRLREWDKLPPEYQKELLQNETALRAFPMFEARSPGQPAPPVEAYSPEKRKKLEEDLARWRSYEPEKQQRITRYFQQFFELSTREQDRALKTLPDPQRELAEQTLRNYEQLPPVERAKYMDGLHRFLRMSPEERQKFLDNAARWETMSPEERRAWRELVAQLPPSPPGLLPSVPTPPLPSESPRRISVTNVQRSK